MPPPASLHECGLFVEAPKLCFQALQKMWKKRDESSGTSSSWADAISSSGFIVQGVHDIKVADYIAQCYHCDAL